MSCVKIALRPQVPSLGQSGHSGRVIVAHYVLVTCRVLVHCRVILRPRRNITQREKDDPLPFSRCVIVTR